ncbi:exodeoxyribonuclease VII small subunit [Micropruina sp.]|uniref:exodeoxyribonuclease VII small subunit n=1 Tax=Micropruina sp. TaxID=2737536 RepID=UPI0039E50D66
MNEQTLSSEQPLSYEQARQRLVEVVQQLESGSVPLSTAMELWREGEALAQRCQEWLDGARTSIEQAQSDGRQEPSDPQG